MKKTTILRKIAIAAIIAIACVGGTFAQNYPAPVGTYDAVLTTNDYVTVGSRMPYYVAPDASIDALITLAVMNKSQFKWQMTDNLNAPIAITPKTYANAALTVGGAAGYYVENEISAIWASPTVAVGTQYKVRAMEHSIPASGVFADGCDGSTSDRLIYVLARPTITFPVAQNSMACGTVPGAAVTFYVPVNVTGLGPWTVTYSVKYNNAAYLVAAPNSVGVFDATVTDVNVFAKAAATTNLLGTPTANVAGLPVVINGGGVTNGYGMYEVTVTNITDQISRKSLDVIASQAADIAGAASYKIYVNPTPVTNPVQHIKNN